MFDDEISAMRDQQNLLITGIIFPEEMNDPDKLKFEAKIFLEINSNQSRVKSDLRQEINEILNPFAAEAIARGVIRVLNDKHGPLQDYFERFSSSRTNLRQPASCLLDCVHLFRHLVMGVFLGALIQIYRSNSRMDKIERL